MFTIFFSAAAAHESVYLPAAQADGRTSCFDPRQAPLTRGTAPYADTVDPSVLAEDVEWMRARLGESLAREGTAPDRIAAADVAMAAWASALRDSKPSSESHLFSRLVLLEVAANSDLSKALGVSARDYEVPIVYTGIAKGRDPARCDLPDGVRRVDPSMVPWLDQRLPQLGADGRTTRVWAVPLSSGGRDDVALVCHGEPWPIVRQPSRGAWPEGAWSWERRGQVGVLDLRGALNADGWADLAAIVEAGSMHRAASKLVVDLRGTDGGALNVLGVAWLEGLLGHRVPVFEDSGCAAWNLDVTRSAGDQTGLVSRLLEASAPGRLTALPSAADTSNKWGGEMVVLVDGYTTWDGERLALAIRAAIPSARIVGGVPAGVAHLPMKTHVVLPRTGIGTDLPMSGPHRVSLEVDLLLAPELAQRPPADLVEVLF